MRAAGFGLQSLQMRTLCDQALTMGGSTARAAGAGVMHAAMAAGGSAVAAQGGSSTAAASGAGGLQALQPAEACRAPAPGGQAAEAAGEGPPSQFWLVPEPGVDVCNHFEDTPATGGLMEGCKGRRTRATLLPLTDEFSMNRQYLCDRTGRVFLRVGAGAMMPSRVCVSATLCACLRRTRVARLLAMRDSTHLLVALLRTPMGHMQEGGFFAHRHAGCWVSLCLPGLCLYPQHGAEVSWFVISPLTPVPLTLTGVMAGFQLMPAADTIVAFLNGLLR